MAVTYNLKGTTSSSFGIGKSGPTIHQGTGTPSAGTGSNGDVFIRSDGTTPQLFQKQSGTWITYAQSNDVVLRNSATTMTALLTLSGDPTNNLEAATKQYVDATISGLDTKESVRVATTANITLSGIQTIDGVTLIAGDRILVKDQSIATENGIYDVAAGAWTRSSDTDNTPGAEFGPGAFTFVEEGTISSDNGFVASGAATGAGALAGYFNLGTDNITWTQFSAAGQVLAGTNLNKSGSTINLDNNVTLNSATDVKLTLQGSASPRIRFESNIDDVYQIDVTSGGFRINNATDSTTEMQFDGAGNIGVGGTSALAKFEITGTNAGYQLRLNTASAGSLGLLMDGNGGFIGTASGSTTDVLRLGTGGIEKMRITSGGNVGIGITTVDTVLHVRDTGGASPATIGTVHNGVAVFRAQNNSLTIGGETSLGNMWIQTAQATALGATRDLAINPRGGDVSIGLGDTVNPDGTLHVHTATAGLVGAGANADDLIVENSGNVGISLLSPSGNTAQIAFGDVADNNIGIILYDHFTNSMQFTTNASEQLRIDSTGKVGINISVPLAKLHVQTAASGQGAVGGDTDEFVIENSGNTGMAIYSGTTSTGNIFFGDSGNDGMGRIVYNHSTDSLSFHTVVSERMRIDNSGNVGIGATPDTAAKLDVNGQLLIRPTGGALDTTPGAQFGMYHQVNPSGVCNIITYSPGGGTSLAFHTNTGAGAAVEAMRINALGRIGIGSSPDSSAQLIVTKTSADAEIISSAASAGFASRVKVRTNNATGALFNEFGSYIGTTLDWRISGGGNGTPASSIAFETGSSGVEQFRVAHVANSVNFWDISGNITTGGIRLKTNGSDTNVSGFFNAKGTGAWFFNHHGSDTQRSLQLTTPVSAVNYLTISGAVATGSPTVGVAGTDANISLNLSPKGTTGQARLMSASGNVRVSANNTGVGFFATAPVAKQTVTGSRGGNAALASLLTALANFGLITDSST